MNFSLKQCVIGLTIAFMVMGYGSSSVITENGSDLIRYSRSLNNNELKTIFNELLKSNTDLNTVAEVKADDLAILIRRAMILCPAYVSLGGPCIDTDSLIDVFLNKDDCDINANVGNYGESLLAVAARMGNVDEFVKLIKADANLSALNTSQLFPVFIKLPEDLTRITLQYVNGDITDELLQQTVLFSDSLMHFNLILEMDISVDALEKALLTSRALNKQHFANLIAAKLIPA